MSNNCIILLNYNDCKRVKRLVRVIERYDSLEYILVVDNHSTDGSFDILKKLTSDKIYVIQTDKNEGYAVGNNFGARYAIRMWNVDTIYFANPDVFFEEEVFTSIEKILWQREDYGIATVMVKEGYNVWELPKYWGTVRMLFLFLFTLYKKRIRNKLREEKGACEIGVVEGSFFAIKSSVFNEVEGFDERTFLYLEENILAYRLRQHGYKEVVITDRFYVHEHSQSISKEYKSKARAFKLFLPSFLIYLKYYLKCNSIQLIAFRVFYVIAFFERILYDIFKRVIKQ